MSYRTIHQVSDATLTTVGDGFNIRRPLPSRSVRQVSPFLLLDHAGPQHIAPTTGAPGGVDQHPHRGFETVTVLYQGALEHRDNQGNYGKLRAGDVQWMTAGRGIIHEEKHAADFAATGGTLELIQLWVNLPAEHKMTDPAYQDIAESDIPVVDLDGGRLRVVAGSYEGTEGAATTFTDLNLWDAQLDAGSEIELPMPNTHQVSIYLRSGSLVITNPEEDSEREPRAILPGQLAVLTGTGDRLAIRAMEHSELLILTGEPINEPVATYGPFVMNTQREIMQALEDYREGRF